MKRYSAEEIHHNVEHGKWCKEFYYNAADLIAAGCLVPVPDGEAVRADNLFPDAVFSSHSGLHVITQPYDGSDYVWPMALDGSGIQQFLCQSIVQPVRLVPLEDVG